MLTILVNQVNLDPKLFRVNNFLVDHIAFNTLHVPLKSNYEIEAMTKDR